MEIMGLPEPLKVESTGYTPAGEVGSEVAISWDDDACDVLSADGPEPAG